MTARRESAEVFARNLARLCAREPSIAAVCRATGINRQQFNRYLAGASIPNAANMRKICRHFKIPEIALFRSNGLNPDPPPKAAWSQSLLSHREAHAVLRLLYRDRRPSIAPGLYFVYFSLTETKTVVRSTMVVRADDDFTTFRRLTGVSERRGSWWRQFSGDHRGIVIERVHWLYFVALNAREFGEPSMMVLRWLPLANRMLGGIGLVSSPAGPTVLPAVVNKATAGTSLRTAIRVSHPYSVDDPRLDPLVLEALEEQARSFSSKIAVSSATPAVVAPPGPQVVPPRPRS